MTTQGTARAPGVPSFFHWLLTEALRVRHAQVEYSIRACVVALFALALFGGAPGAGAATVGHVAGTFAVTPQGAASYTIPLWTPPGPHGLQPHLSLIYNSQAGNGPEGVGWSIAGLSSIYRCKLTSAQDSTAAAITLTYADRFCLDGKRLRLTSSENLATYGADGTTYQTEVADFSNVTAHGAFGQGPAYFTVQGRDGLIYEYGNTSDSQLGNGTTAFGWMLDKVSDRAGNTMLVTWRTADANLAGMTVPNSVSWTPVSKGSNQYTYTMQFNYLALPLAVNARYLAGQVVQNYYSLNTIQIMASGALIKQYSLGYTLSGTTGRETLTTIEECAGTRPLNCLYATTFVYPGGQVGVGSATTLSSTTQAPTGLATAYDFNGDGRADLTWYANGVWQVAFGTSTGYSAPTSTGITSSNVSIGDADGSGLDGFIAPVSGNWEYYKWNGSSFAATVVQAQVDQSNRFALVDVDGDGLPDLVTTGTDAYIYVRLNQTLQTGSLSFSSTAIKTIQNTYLVLATAAGAGRTLDFSGSGQQDLLATHLNGFSGTILNVLHFNGTTFIPTALNAGAALDVGDYNDDGCSDILQQSNTLYLAACSGSVAQTITLPATAVAAMDWDGDGRRDVLVANGSTLGVYLSDGNGLNTTTLLTTSIPYSSSNTYTVAHNPTGDGSDALIVTSGSSPYTIQYYLHNGQGQAADLLSNVTDGYGNSVSPTYTSIAQGSYTIGTGVKAGYRNFIGPMYVVNAVTFSDPSSATGGTYSQTYSYADGWMSLQGRGFSAFQRVEHQDSRTGLWETLGYEYYFPYIGNPVLDNLTVDQAGNQEVKYSFVGEQDITLDGTANNQRYFVYNNLTTQTYQVSWTPTGGNTVGPRIETDTTTYTNWDNYGNPGTITVVRTDQDANSPYNTISWTTTTSLTPYIDDPSFTGSAQSAWCVGLIETRQVQYTGGPTGTLPVTRHQSSTANPTDLAACRLTSLITEPNSSQYEATEAFTYDGFGNLATDTMTGLNMSPRQTSFAWTSASSTTGQFLLSATDASGATTQYTYDPLFGMRTGMTDPNGVATAWFYDSFNREVQENRADKTITQWGYADCASNGGCPIGSHGRQVSQVVSNTDGTVQTDTTTWFDPLERPLLSKQRALAAGTYNRNEVRYDSLGHVAQKAFPCPYVSVSTSCPYWTTLNFDWLDRLTRSQRPVSATNGTLQSVRYQYSGSETVVTDENGHSKTLTTDVNGGLRQILDTNGYLVTRSYDAAGSLTGVTDSLGNALFSAGYSYGIGAFMTSSTDADLGPWSYTVDALGERTHWTDPNGHSFSATYDGLSRMTTRSEPDLFTQWTWGTSATVHEIGQLHSVCTGTNPTAAPRSCSTPPDVAGYAESETYDSVGRRAQRSIQIPGDTTYNFAWTYNPTTELLDTLTYPTSTPGYALTVKYAYTNGLLQSITDTSDTPNVALWTANTENARGQLTEETFGNGVVVNHSIDAVTGWPSSITAGVGGGAALQNNAYLFDEVGNLTQRQDNNRGLTENVYPDVMNRIDHTTLNGTTNLALTYDATGNILTSQLEGGPVNTNDYQTQQPGCSYYGNTQPHAQHSTTNTEVGTTSFCYDANGNGTQELVSGFTYGASTWTSFNQPHLMSLYDGSASQFSYTGDHQRWQQVATFSDGSTQTTEYIGGLFDKISNSNGTAYDYYIHAGSNIVVYTRWNTGETPLYYITADHLGSSALITDSTGAAVLTESFAALGYRRSSTAWAGPPSDAEWAGIDSTTTRGFTGQEMVDHLGVVNMNGRIYMETGEFASPDPFIADPSNTQDYNRYAYVRNNPLTLIDPTGYDACFTFYQEVDDWGPDYGEGGIISNNPSFIPSQFCIPDPPPVTPGVPVAPPGIRSSLSKLTPQIRFTPLQNNDQLPPCKTFAEDVAARRSAATENAVAAREEEGGAEAIVSAQSSVTDVVGIASDVSGEAAKAAGQSIEAAEMLSRATMVWGAAFTLNDVAQAVRTRNSDQEFDAGYGIAAFIGSRINVGFGIGMSLANIVGKLARTPNPVIQEIANAGPTCRPQN